MNTETVIAENLPDQKKLWLAAIKLPMYSVAIMPIWLGTAVAIYEKQPVNWLTSCLFMVSAVLILAWENITNDVFDAETGIDQNKHHSLVNLTGKKQLVFALGNLFLLLGIFGVFLISWQQQDPTIIGLIIICCFLGYIYQGPPFRLGYQGLGEILCFFAFGPIGLSAVYYSQTQSYSGSNFIVSIILGITTSIILFCSHFHQVQDDINAGKKSPIVRLGTKAGADILNYACITVFLLIIVFVILGFLPLLTLITLLSIPLAIKLCDHVQSHHDQPELVNNCKFLAVNFHFISGLLLGIGLILGNHF
jgi:1,4-dihydroxy-2-naphthoate octaprenyltransferase